MIKKTYKRKQKGGVRLMNPFLYQEPTRSFPAFINPKWRMGTTRWNTLIKIEGRNNTNIQLYGTSMPIGQDLEGRQEIGFAGPYTDYNIYCFRTFVFYMYNLEINRLISLQACDEILRNPAKYQPAGCGNDYDMERRIWESVKNLDMNNSNNNNILYSPQYIQDFTCGHYQKWRNVIEIDYTIPQNRSILHCYAGFGRTGWALFSVIMKYYINGTLLNTDTQNMINIPVINQIQIGQHLMGFTTHRFSHTLKNILRSFIKLKNNTNHDYINDRIAEFNIEGMIEEVFDWRDRGVISLNLFIRRYNTLLLCLALHFGINSIPLYKTVDVTYDYFGFNYIGEILDDIFMNDPRYNRCNIGNIPYLIDNGTDDEKRALRMFFDVE